jgi:hypothetical protein
MMILLYARVRINNKLVNKEVNKTCNYRVQSFLHMQIKRGDENRPSNKIKFIGGKRERNTNLCPIQHTIGSIGDQ